MDILEKYISLELLRLDRTADLVIDIDETIDQEHVLIPSMLLQPLVENALIHGVRQTRDEVGRLLIICHQGEGCLNLIIQDNGPGIKAGKQSAQSAGLDITRQRIDTMNQIYHLDLEMSIQDLSDVNEGESGTRITIHLNTTTRT